MNGVRSVMTAGISRRLGSYAVSLVSLVPSAHMATLTLEKGQARSGWTMSIALARRVDWPAADTTDGGAITATMGKMQESYAKKVMVSGFGNC